MAISAALVKELRERTGVGMMECKKFLQQTNGDIEEAIAEMRKAGAAKVAKKDGRVTAEGLVAVAVSSDRKLAAIIEANCETDFVCRNEDFMGFAQLCADQAIAHRCADVDSLSNAPSNHGDLNIDQYRQQLIVKIGENINLRRVTLIQATGEVSHYLHGARIGVLIDVVSGNDELGKDLAMHVAASNPVVVAGKDVPQELLDKEKEIYSAQAAESGKPADIIEKMIQGRLNKFLEEVSLEGQSFVKDPEQKVAALLKAAGAKVASFIRYEVGEGIAQKQENFADAVMAQVRGTN